MADGTDSTIVADTKDWTWVLERPCPECGFDAAEFDRTRIGAMIRSDVATWAPLLDHPDVARRPNPAQWSALEYACHVRDVYRLFDQRLTLMLTDDDPTFANWDQDATAIEGNYGDQSPTMVGRELSEAGQRLADHFDQVGGDQWDRTGHRSDGASFTVGSFACYLIHDPVHHQWDVARGFATMD